MDFDRRSGLLGTIFCLTFLVIFAQFAACVVHLHANEVVDALAGAAILRDLLHPVILIPIAFFILIQLGAYLLFMCWVWFVAIALQNMVHLSERQTYWFGLGLWCMACVLILSLNAHFYQNSYFAAPFLTSVWKRRFFDAVMYLSSATWVVLTMVALYAWVIGRLHENKLAKWTGACLVLTITMSGSMWLYDLFMLSMHKSSQDKRPNIIVIGLDSVRPDHVHQLSHQNINTKNIDHFLQSAAVFSEAYTPLARTYPAWISLLTAKYPKHNHARMNLVAPGAVLANDNLARHLQTLGYQTIYGTDETRFTDITTAYGFDVLLGPRGGAAEFLLAGMSDFPLTNLLVNLPVGRYLFPYHYGNRAADVTYRPENFLNLVKHGLAQRDDRPVFIALHLCLSHWPFTWADEDQMHAELLSQRYRRGVEGVDQQFGHLIQLLADAGVLQHSLVVLLSDHGTALGMPGDRLLIEKKYRGDKKNLHQVMRYKLETAPEFTLDFKHDFSMATSYGQGTDVLSPKQYHVVLAMRGFGVPVATKKVSQLSSLLDVAPTVLELLQLPPLQHVDGVSLASALDDKSMPAYSKRPFFMETGDKIAEIETNNIQAEKVVMRMAHAYHVDANDGLLQLNPAAAQGMIAAKQLAVRSGDWLLAYYPASTRAGLVRDASGSKLVIKEQTTRPYFVLVNLRTDEWTIGLDSPWGRQAPRMALLSKLKNFYGAEIK